METYANTASTTPITQTMRGERNACRTKRVGWVKIIKEGSIGHLYKNNNIILVYKIK
jgi:uncharacterized protein YcfJ